MLLRNSDQGKYGSLLNGLVSQFSMQNNQYPRTISDATDILSNHQHGNWKDQKKKWQQPKKGDDTSANAKDKGETKETSFVQGGNKNKDKTCSCCGEKGHISPECPKVDSIPKKDWAFRNKKTQLNQQAEHDDEQSETESNTDNDSVTSKRSSTRVGWSGLLV